MAFLLPTPLTPLAKASIRADLQVYWRIPVSHCPTARSLPVVSARSSSCMRLGWGSPGRPTPRATGQPAHPSSRSITFPAAGHVQSFPVAPRQYENQILAFLDGVQ